MVRSGPHRVGFRCQGELEEMLVLRRWGKPFAGIRARFVPGFGPGTAHRSVSTAEP